MTTHAVGAGRVGDLSWRGARDIARRLPCPLEPERVALDGAAGRVLAGPVLARAALPGCDIAAMDGYAVRGPLPCVLVGRRFAGDAAGAALEPGTAVEIATGAPVPAGAEAVLPYECCRRDGSLVFGPYEAGQHIRRCGEDARAGDEIVPAGRRVTSAVLGAAAQAGADALLVYRRPRVRLIVTGDEIVRGGVPGPGLVRDAFGPSVAAITAAAGGVVTGTAYVRDDGAALHAAIARAASGVVAGSVHDVVACAASGLVAGSVHDAVACAAPGVGAGSVHDAVACAAPGVNTGSVHVCDAAAAGDGDDVLVVTGSSSVGAADHLHRVLAGLGAVWHVDGVRCRPGHPQLLARIPGGPWVVGLPGNPFAGLVAALTLLQPLLEALTGTAGAPVVRLPVTGAARVPDDGVRLVPVRLETTRAAIVPAARPGSLRAAATADALAVIEAGWADGSPCDLLAIP